MAGHIKTGEDLRKYYGRDCYSSNVLKDDVDFILRRHVKNLKENNFRELFFHGASSFVHCLTLLGYSPKQILDKMNGNSDTIQENLFEEYIFGELKIPDSIKQIKTYGFSYAYITKLDLNNVEYLGKWAFFGCDDLKEISMAYKNIEINENTFESCWHIETINITDLTYDEFMTNYDTEYLESRFSDSTHNGINVVFKDGKILEL